MDAGQKKAAREASLDFACLQQERFLTKTELEVLEEHDTAYAED